MHDEAFFTTNRQPVLPLPDLLSQKQSQKLVPTAIGAKIKSFEIPRFSHRQIRVFGRGAIDLPYFADLESYIPLVYSQQVAESLATPARPIYNFRTIARFWWHCLLAAHKQVSLLVLLILFQSSSQASNFLERAKIYIDLDSQKVATLPASSQVYLQQSQASPFNRAIQKSREISQDSPFYAQAQADINRWSEIIWDIAQGRANEGDFTGAVLAANLIPQNHPTTEQLAQRATVAVQHWRQRGEQKLYQDYLAKARAIIEPEQASSYNRAIGILNQVVFKTEEFSVAQNQIHEWNKQIYLIAKQRVERGEFKQAVEAAKLISPNSIYHQLAKDEIEQKIKSIYARYLN